MVKSPFAELTALPAAPAGIGLTFTVAPATGFPSGSMTLPAMAPVCAYRFQVQNHRAAKIAMHLFIACRFFKESYPEDVAKAESFRFSDQQSPLADL